MQHVTFFPYVVDKGKGRGNKRRGEVSGLKKMPGICFKKRRNCLRIQKKMLKFG